MMNHITKKPYNALPGTVIKGKWHGHSYQVIKKLGEGATGIVYLVSLDGSRYAMKISDNVANVSSEMNVLKSFSKVPGSALGPSLLHGDDWICNGTTFPFYVMEYVSGKELLTFIKENGESWANILMLQLLTSLGKLHEEGWVFGDLKPENLIVTMPSCKIRCVDVGGTTQSGRAIKEFTEFFDRGYWGLGTRKADPAYDLFAVVMICINMYHPVRFKKGKDTLVQLTKVIENTKQLRPYKTILLHALKGKFRTAEEMRSQLLAVVQAKGKTVSADASPITRSSRKPKKKKGRFLETALLFLFVCCLYGLYLYMQITG